MLDRPTITYKQARDLMLPHFEAGMKPARIAATLNATVPFDLVMKIAANMRRNRTRHKTRLGVVDRTINIWISTAVYDDLKLHADVRKISVSKICGLLIDASSTCVDAVLDDRA